MTKLEDDKIEDHCTPAEFSELFNEAEANAKSDYATKFIDDLDNNFSVYGMKTYMSAAQYEFLRKLAAGETK